MNRRTPPERTMPNWLNPRPVIGVLAFGALVWLYTGIVPLYTFHNTILLPVWILLGCATIPVAVLFIFMQLSAHLGGPSTRSMARAAIVGGISAIVIGGTLDTIVVHLAGVLDARWFAGCIEETAKLAITVAIARATHLRGLTTGFLLGTAVGIGFEISENLGYAIAPFLGTATSQADIITSVSDQALRTLTGLFGHPVWCAIASSVALGNGHPRIPQSLRWVPTILTLAAVSIAHTIWDTAGLTAAPAALAALGQGSPALLAGCASTVTLLAWGSVLTVTYRSPGAHEPGSPSADEPTVS